jgi:hypothetical protein
MAERIIDGMMSGSGKSAEDAKAQRAQRILFSGFTS